MKQRIVITVHTVILCFWRPSTASICSIFIVSTYQIHTSEVWGAPLYFKYAECHNMTGVNQPVSKLTWIESLSPSHTKSAPCCSVTMSEMVLESMGFVVFVETQPMAGIISLHSRMQIWSGISQEVRFKRFRICRHARYERWDQLDVCRDDPRPLIYRWGVSFKYSPSSMRLQRSGVKFW